MERSKSIWLFLAVGSFVGGYIPVLWGGSMFGIASVLLTAVGGFLGIWIGFKLGN